MSLKSVEHLECHKASKSVKGTQWESMCISRVFQGCIKGVSRKFQGSFKVVSRVFQGSFRDVSRKFQGYFKKVSRVFQQFFFQEWLKGCSMEVLRLPEECFPGVGSCIHISKQFCGFFNKLFPFCVSQIS